MKVWDKLRALLPTRKRNPGGRQRVRDEPEDTRVAVRPLSDRSMIANEAIFAAVNRIATTMASMPFHLYQGDKPLVDHPLERLLNYRPNEQMNAHLWKLTMQSNVCCYGSAYSLIIPGADMRPARLDVLRPELVTPMIEEKTGELWYDVVDALNGMHYWVHRSSMIVLSFMGGNGLRGIRPIDVLRGTMQYDAEIKRFSLEQLKSVNNSILLTVPGVGLGEEETEQLISDFISRYNKSGRSVVVLEGGMTASALTKSPVDAKVLDIERITRNRVATVYAIPPHMLGDYTDTSYSTAEQSVQEFLQLTMLGWVTQWETELDSALLTWDLIQEGLHWVIDMQSLYRADTMTMANKHSLAVRGGWMQPNEVRKMDGLPPDPDGDCLLVSRDLLPLAMVRGGATIKET